MIQISESLQRLTLDITELQEATLSRPIDPAPYLRQLDRAVQALEAKFEKISLPKPPFDGDEVWAKWRAAGFDRSKLDAREIRTLCVSPKTAMKARLIETLTADPEPLMRWINFNGFVQAYFAQWRSMDEPQNAERLIVSMLVKGRVPRNSKILELWRRSAFLFSSEAADHLGQIVLRDRTSVKQACANYAIDSTTALAIAAHEQVTSAAIAELVQRDVHIGQDTALKELQWITVNLLTSALSPEGYRQAMSKLIVSRLAEGMPLFQSAIVDLVHADERLGDPRLAYCAPNWRNIPEARAGFLAWLARETLQFFFDTLVPRNDTNRRRADFWLQYAKKQGKIKDFQVAVSYDDQAKIRASRAKTIPSHSSITGGKTSAFLMIFEGYGTEYVVIEFSETGNAAYIYLRKTFEARRITIRSNSFDLTDDLKRKAAAEDRIWHRTNTIEPWEVQAHKQLAELGIRP